MQLLSHDTLIVQLYSLDTPVLLFIYTQDVGMLQFHTMVLLVLDTQVYFGHTAISHDGAAGSLNTQV